MKIMIRVNGGWVLCPPVSWFPRRMLKPRRLFGRLSPRNTHRTLYRSVSFPKSSKLGLLVTQWQR
jgi:hypothetical protein